MATSERLMGLLAKEESTYGTDPTPTVVADGVRSVEPLHGLIQTRHIWENELRDDATGSLFNSLAGAAKAGRVATITLPWRVRGVGSAYADTRAGKPEAGPLITSCGTAETVDTTGGSEKVEYTPSSAAHTSCTIWAYSASKLYKVSGCRGTFTWPLDVGQPNIWRFVMQGIVTSITELALPGITMQATVPPPATGLALTVGGVSLRVYAAELNLGARVQELTSGNASDGIDEYAIDMFEPIFGLSARTVALATLDPWSDAATPTSRAIAGTLGGTQYNKVSIVNTNTIPRDPEHAVNEGFTAYDLNYVLRDLILRFT